MGEEPAEPALLERGAVTASLDAAIDGCRAGAGSAVFLVGEAGIGKTSLLARSAARAAAGADPVAVRWAAGTDLERTTAFGLVSQVLGTAEVADVLDGVHDGPGVVGSPTAYVRVARWLEGLDGPTVLLVDDAHAADPDSLGLLAFLVRRIAGTSVSLVVALRPWPTTAVDLAASLADAGHAELHRLAPLSRAASATLLDSASGHPLDPAEQARAFDLCQGNPLLIEQVAHALRSGAAVADLATGDLPLSESLLFRRFAGLDDDALEVLRLASVAGEALPLELALDLTGLEGPALGKAVLALVGSGLMRDVPGGLAFVHPLFAQAAYQTMPVAARRLLHLRCFDALLARGRRSEAVAHARRAEVVGDERVAAAIEDEGRAALAAGAVAVAIDHLDAAVRTSGDVAPPWRRLVLAQALVAAGRATEAIDLAAAVLREPRLDAEPRGHAHRLLGRAWCLAGQIERGTAELQAAVDVALPDHPERAVEALLDESLVVWLAAGPGPALDLVDRARGLTDAVGPALQEQIEATWGHVAFEAGDPEGLAVTRPILDRLIASASADPRVDATDATWPWAIAPLVANNAKHAERFDRADAGFRCALDAAEEAGTAEALASLLVFVANLRVRRGDLAEALDAAGSAIAYADLTLLATEYAHFAAAEVLLWMGELDKFEEQCALAAPGAEGQWFLRFWQGHLRGLRLLWSGDPAASDHLLAVEAVGREAGVGEPCLVQWGTHAVAAHCRVGRVDDAERVVGWLAERADHLPCRYPRAAARLGSALVAEATGDLQIAVDAAVDAAELLEGSGLRLHQAEALLALGRLQRRAGRTTDARAPLARALQLAEATGAGHLRRTAAAELALVGGRRRRVPHGALSPAERRVAQLAADGASNAAIALALHLSVNTVETHLRHAYAKLGIRSRRDLPGRL